MGEVIDLVLVRNAKRKLSPPISAELRGNTVHFAIARREFSMSAQELRVWAERFLYLAERAEDGSDEESGL